MVLVLAGVGALAFVLSRLVGGDSHMATMVWVVGVGLALSMPFLAGTLALRVYRDIATPLAEVMGAADGVAAGDLGVRVAESGEMPEPFARLAHSFNRMAAELERADQHRRNLTADVAHELRTPLQIIQGNLEGVLDGVYRPTDEHLEATLAEARRLARMVEDLRTLSLAEAGALPLEWEETDLQEILQDVCTTFGGQAEAAGIVLTLGAQGSGSPLVIMTDVGRLEQILSNLVANAVRHTQRGGRISLSAQAGGDTVRIAVEDNGEGIAVEDLPFVFDRFWRGDRARTRGDGGGTGLGLAIARQLAHALRGEIRVESELGTGSRFTVALPYAKETPAANRT
jgi:two-component system OmpR family sensor kinase/two-component system sensor histidine kinase BaeS